MHLDQFLSQIVPMQPDVDKQSVLLTFLCVNERYAIFPALKYNLSLPLVVSPHLVLFLSAVRQI